MLENASLTLPAERQAVDIALTSSRVTLVDADGKPFAHRAAYVEGRFGGALTSSGAWWRTDREGALDLTLPAAAGLLDVKVDNRGVLWTILRRPPARRVLTIPN